jgi:hypothetical protein
MFNALDYEMEDLRCDLMNEISEDLTDEEIEKLERKAIEASLLRDYYNMVKF